MGELRRAGESAIDCIKAICEVEGVGLAEAKRLFCECQTWSDVHRFQEDLRENSKGWQRNGNAINGLRRIAR